jgi:glutamyl-tRNA reductase
MLRDLSPREREALDSLTAAIVNKILHAPIASLKQPDKRSEAFFIDATRRLFDLEGTEDS